ncbi:MAG: permease prefix domain 1-containing protein, partial [Vicinamibacterales bacterium]
MGALKSLRLRLRGLYIRSSGDSEHDEEIRFHIDKETERLVREGVGAGEARRRALVAFGGVALTKEA